MSSVYMANNGKDNTHTRNTSRRVNFVSNGESCRMHQIYWCEGGLKLSDIATKNVGENDLNPRIEYIMVRLYNWDRTLGQKGWQNTG